MTDPESIPWTDEEYALARAALYSLQDTLEHLGLSPNEAVAATHKPAMSIGDEEIGYSRWLNRFLAYSDRLEKKIASPS